MEFDLVPQRFLRPGLTTSQRFNAIAWPAQSLYTRLITLVDDFGRYEADFRLLRSHAFPYGDPNGKAVPVSSIEAWCKLLSQADLVIFYSLKDKNYLQITRWLERVRADKSKYPTFDNTCQQMFANDNKCSLPSPPSSPSPIAISTSSNGAHAPSVHSIAEEIYKAYPRRIGKDDALQAITKRIKSGVSPAHLLEKTSAFAKTQPKNWTYTPYPATWFNRGSYDDDPATWTPIERPRVKQKPISPDQERLDREYEEAQREWHLKKQEKNASK